MTTVRASIKPKEVDRHGKVNIKIRIWHKGTARYISTKFRVPPKQFILKSGRVSKAHPMHPFINAELRILESQYETKLLNSGQIESKSIKSVVGILKRKVKTVNIFDLFEQKIVELKQLDSSTWDKYSTTKVVLERFNGSGNLEMQEIDESYLKTFMMDRLKSGKSINTVGIDLRNIRALFNQAIADELISADLYPFRKFKIPTKKTQKRNLAIKHMKKLYHAKLEGKEKQSVDIFFLSFFLIGMNMKDIFNLKKSDVQEDRIVYDRAKTHKGYSVKIEPEAMKIIQRYSTDEGEYLFSFRSQYARPYEFTKAVNKFVKRVAALKKIAIPITTYYARHSWATIAYNGGVSKDVVKLALGHGSETTTDIYINVDQSLIDEANRKVIDLTV